MKLPHGDRGSALETTGLSVSPARFDIAVLEPCIRRTRWDCACLLDRGIEATRKLHAHIEH
jgi:hypothetical protein